MRRRRLSACTCRIGRQRAWDLLSQLSVCFAAGAATIAGMSHLLPPPPAAACPRRGTVAQSLVASAVAADREMVSGATHSGGLQTGGLNGRRGRVAGTEHSPLTIRAARFAQRVNEEMWHRQLAGELLEGERRCAKHIFLRPQLLVEATRCQKSVTVSPRPFPQVAGAPLLSEIFSWAAEHGNLCCGCDRRCNLQRRSACRRLSENTLCSMHLALVGLPDLIMHWVHPTASISAAFEGGTRTSPWTSGERHPAYRALLSVLCSHLCLLDIAKRPFGPEHENIVLLALGKAGTARAAWPRRDGEQHPAFDARLAWQLKPGRPSCRGRDHDVASLPLWQPPSPQTVMRPRVHLPHFTNSVSMRPAALRVLSPRRQGGSRRSCLLAPPGKWASRPLGLW